jgi:hypothetical protein
MFTYDSGNLYWKISRPRTAIGKNASRVNNNGYLQTCINGKRYSTHRIIFLMHNNYLPDIIDHIDGNPKNNNIENLRQATRSENQYNRKPQKCSSGVKGVTFHKDTGKWMAQISTNGKNKYLGLFNNIYSAKEIVDTARKENHKEFARSLL